MDAQNGATTEEGAFALSRPLQAGAFNYTLNRDSDEDWYLRSENAYRAEVPLYASMLTQAMDYDRILAGSRSHQTGVNGENNSVRLSIQGGHLGHDNNGGTGPSDSWWQSGFLLCRTRSALTRHRHNHITPVFTFIFCLQRYHTMKIITRGEAMRIHQQHPASRLFPFCTGKYRWHGSAETYTGREVQDIPGVLAVFAERRKDSFGPYVRLMSVTLN